MGTPLLAILVWILIMIILIVLIGEIRFKLSLKKENENSYYMRKIKEIRKILKKNNYPCHFDKRKFKGRILNCYAYALDINVSDPKKIIWIPGCISDENLDKNIYTVDELVDRLKKDLDFLGISYRDDTSTLLDGEWRIAIYYIPFIHDWPFGFHISRQDVNGIWSEKISWEGEIEKIGNKCDAPPDFKKDFVFLEKVLILSKK